MADIISIANGVVTALSAYSAVLSYDPEYDLKDIETQRCVVVPVGVSYKSMSRSMIQTEYRIDVALLYRSKNLNMSDLLDKSKTIASLLLRKSISGVICVEAVHEPLFAPEYIRQRNQFASVIVLKFREVCDG